MLVFCRGIRSPSRAEIKKAITLFRTSPGELMNEVAQANQKSAISPDENRFAGKVAIVRRMSEDIELQVSSGWRQQRCLNPKISVAS